MNIRHIRQWSGVTKAVATMLRKRSNFTVTKSAGRVRRFCISSSRVDRDNDTINPNGWDVADFLKNGVILWAHNYESMPVGRGFNFQIAGDKVYLDIEFADTPEGNACLAMIDAGMINACSVGFSALESIYNSARGGMDYIRQSLLEVSIVPVPANPDALVVRSKALGISDATIRKMFGGGSTAGADDVVLELAADEPVITLKDEPTLSDVQEAINRATDAIADASAKRATRRSVDGRAYQAARFKAGRVLSGANASHIANAREHLSAASSHLDEVMNSASDDADDDKSAIVLTLSDEPIFRRSEPFIDPGMVRSVLPRILRESLRDVVSPEAIREEVRRALRLARGRVD